MFEIIKNFFCKNTKAKEVKRESSPIERNDIVHIKWNEYDISNNAIGRVVYIAEDGSYIILDLIGLTDYVDMSDEVKMFRSKYTIRIDAVNVEKIARLYLSF